MRPACILLLLALPLTAAAQEPIRRRLDTPQTSGGVSCGTTGRAYAEFHPDGTLRSCPLARDTTVEGNAFRAGTWITLDEGGLLRSAWLSVDTPLSGHLCRGTGYKGFAVTFHDDGSLATCYLARDTVIDGIPCIHGSFWTEIRGGTKSAARFHPDGSLSGCQLSRDAVVDGKQLRKWDRVTGRPARYPSLDFALLERWPRG